jgi:hypothetical protein
MMKLKIKFGPEIRFDRPIRRITRTRAPWSQGFQVLLCELEMAGWPKPIKRRIDQWCFSGGL